jgi:TonB family protein
MSREGLCRVSVLAVCLVCPVVAAANDGLEAARRLYAAAAYEDALKTLEGLQPDTTGAAAVEIHQQRLLCLVALGRPADAERAMTAIVRADPLYLPDASSAPPRVRAAFLDVRARLVPEIVKSEYERARQAFQSADYPAASAGFARVLAIVGQTEGTSTDPVVRDVAVLATGFKTLSDTANAPPPAPPPAPLPAVADPRPAVAVPPVPPPVRIYDAAYPRLRAAETVRQEIPQWPRSLGPPPNRDGVLEVVIDQEGRIESARMVRAVNRAYDQLLLAAASTWSYLPAQLAGERVKVRKTIKLRFK